MKVSEYTAENKEGFKEAVPCESSGPLQVGDSSTPAGARGFAQIFGLHPAVAVLTFAVDSMLFAADWGTLGAFWPVSVGVAAALGFITYRAQMKWYGDDAESAKIKGLILVLLTAIPVPIPAFLSVPAGIVGFVHTLKGGK
jgi:hypothetical protein